jgi:hypothetical protein
MRSAGVIFAHSRNFCSAVFVSAGFAVNVDFVGLAAGVATASGNEMDMMAYGLRNRTRFVPQASCHAATF